MSEFREPWKIEQIGSTWEQFVVDSGGNLVSIGDHIPRVLAAVNFCRNLPTEWLQKHVAASDQSSFGKFRADEILYVEEVR